MAVLVLSRPLSAGRPREAESTPAEDRVDVGASEPRGPGQGVHLQRCTAVLRSPVREFARRVELGGGRRVSLAAAPTLGDRLAGSRLAHRESRLRLALAVLYARVRDLEHRGERVPKGLLAAIKGFQDDLVDARGRAAELGAEPAVEHPDRHDRLAGRS
jgi:hypothetical protein